MPVNQPFHVYREQLTSQYHGLALWNPKPVKGLYDHVSIGDVGYIYDGNFIRMFNVKLPWDDPSNTKFRPPKEFKSLDRDFFDNVCGNEFDQAEYHSPPVSKVDNAGNVQAGTADQARGQTYTCRARSHGALLSLPHGGYREDVIRTKAFEDYIRDNVVSWFTWAQNNKLGVERMEDLILVTGCTLVTSWAAAAFDDTTAMPADATSISLDAQKFDRGGAQFIWRNIRGNVEYHNSRFNPNDETPLPQNQCVFIRGFRAKRTFFGIKHLRAAAEPLPEDPDNSREDEIQVTQVPSVQKHRDPLIGVLDYIVEKCIEDSVDEDAIAIAHDDDLRHVNSDGVETLTADEVEKFLREKQMPLLVEKGAAILRDPRDIETPDEKKATFYAAAEFNGEPVPLVIHPVLTKYFLKLEMTNSVEHDYDLPKEELTSSAVYPPVLLLKLESYQGYPQVISIEASDDSQGVGVTVQEVLRTIHEDLRIPIPAHELNKLNVKDWTAKDSAFGESPARGHKLEPMADLYPNQSSENSYQPQSFYHQRPQDPQIFTQLRQPYHFSSPAAYLFHLDDDYFEVSSTPPLSPQGSLSTISTRFTTAVEGSSAPDLPLSMGLNGEMPVLNESMEKMKLGDLGDYTLDASPEYMSGDTDHQRGNLMFSFDPTNSPGNEDMLSAVHRIQNPTWLENILLPGFSFSAEESIPAHSMLVNDYHTSHSSPVDTANRNSPPKSESIAHSPQLQQPHHGQHQQGEQAQRPQQQQESNVTKTDTGPPATFLTKLYALLERPENHHMIHWDPAGENIIVGRPEQLSLHVLPSIYRQSRFASFSRQLNIYGFMRKVNLRNVDPAIDDPGASVWSHPTLNRHTPPEIVANFKRRVPPRLPKPRKRPHTDQRSAIHPGSASSLGAAPLIIPGLTSSPKGERVRGLYTFGSNPPMAQAEITGKWGDKYNRAVYTSDEEPRNGPRRVDYLNGRDRLQILPKFSPDGSISLPTSTLRTLPGTSDLELLKEYYM